MSHTIVKTCPRCEGEGEVEVQHPRFGSRTCEEPTAWVPCPACHPEAFRRAVA